MKKIVASLIAVSMAVAPMGMAMSHAVCKDCCEIKAIDKKYGEISEDYVYTCTEDGCKFVDENSNLYDEVKVDGKKYQLDKNGEIVETELKDEEIVSKKGHKLRNAIIVAGAVAAGVAAYKYLGKECDKTRCNSLVKTDGEGTSSTKNDEICGVCKAKTNMEITFSNTFSKIKKTKGYEKAGKLYGNIKKLGNNVVAKFSSKNAEEPTTPTTSAPVTEQASVTKLVTEGQTAVKLVDNGENSEATKKGTGSLTGAID